MELYGIHHITAITANARANVDFYTRVLGLRFVKKTVNFDDPTIYHLHYADDAGTPGSILSFFEYPGVARGRTGPGMAHRVVWRVADESALDFWQQRLAGQGQAPERSRGRLRFTDPDGLELELVVDASGEAALTAAARDIPADCALRGLDGVRVYHREPWRSVDLLREMSFEEARPAVNGTPDAVSWRLSGGGRSSWLAYDPAPATRALPGAGTVHHVAWATPDAMQSDWRSVIAANGLHPTQIIDGTYCRSVYFREPSGVLFELATVGPGFAVDEPPDQLGERLQLPPRYERMRWLLEEELTPLVVPKLAA